MIKDTCLVYNVLNARSGQKEPNNLMILFTQKHRQENIGRGDINLDHSLSHQGVWASFHHPNPQKFNSPKCFERNSLKNVIFKHENDFIHLNVIPMTLYKGIMPYFNE